MKVAEAKTSSSASSKVQAKRQPFFSKDREGSFFSKSNEATTSFFSPATIQPKLTIGQPNDKYEVEADAMADRVVQRLSNKAPTNDSPLEAVAERGRSRGKGGVFAKHGTFLQTKCSDCEEEEKIQEKKEEGVQLKPIFESNGEQSDGEVQTKPIGLPAIQKKCSSCEQDEIQAKAEDTTTNGTSSLESKLSSSKGSGNPLSPKVGNVMGSAFGTDFNNVRVHTGSDAVQMNRQLGAQAFTHGNDIYFNQGKYDTNSRSGKHLLAHELTHTVQQGGLLVPKLQKLGDDELIEGPPIPDNTPVEQSGEECPDLIPDYPSQPEVAPSGESETDEGFYSNLLGFAGITQGLPGPLGLITNVVGNIAFWTWSQLPNSIKIRAINIALNNAERAYLSGTVLGRYMWGSAFGWVSAAMLGFIRKVKTLDNEEKIRIFEKAGKILLGQSLDFTLGMLKGIVIGIVMDGLVGIIQLVIDLFCLIPKILDFFKSLKNFFEQLPEEMMALYHNLALVKSNISGVMDNAMGEFLEMIRNPGKVMLLLNAIYDAGVSAAEKVGEAMASGMIRAYRLPAFSLGEIVGRIGGQVIFEALLIYFTAGTGAFVTGAKLALRVIGKFLMKIGRYIFTIVKFLGKVLRKIGSVLKGVGKFLSKGLKAVTTSLRGVIDKIVNLFRKFGKYCRPGSTICHIPHGLVNVLKRTRNGFYLIQGDLRTGWLHIQARHIVGGARVTSGTSMFPRGLSGGRIRNLVVEAVENGKVIRNQAGGRRLIRYTTNQHGIREIEVWVNNTTRVIETAYPTKGPAVWIAR